jgi:hypothetical protein
MIGMADAACAIVAGAVRPNASSLGKRRRLAGGQRRFDVIEGRQVAAFDFADAEGLVVFENEVVV